MTGRLADRILPYRLSMLPSTSVSTGTPVGLWPIEPERYLDDASLDRLRPYGIPSAATASPKFTFRDPMRPRRSLPPVDTHPEVEAQAAISLEALRKSIEDFSRATAPLQAALAHVRQSPSRATLSGAGATDGNLEELTKAIEARFPFAKVSIKEHSDEEEGWTRPLLEVETGIIDEAGLAKFEDEFYTEVMDHEQLIEAMKSTTVLIL